MTTLLLILSSISYVGMIVLGWLFYLQHKFNKTMIHALNIDDATFDMIKGEIEDLEGRIRELEG